MIAASPPSAFDPTFLDEETEIAALARAVEFAEGFSLIFVRCNLPSQRTRILNELSARLPDKPLSILDVSVQTFSLLDTLRESSTEVGTGPIAVIGIENQLPRADQAVHSAFVANLNAGRDVFPAVVKSALLLFVPEYLVNAIAQGAPDFFSVRSGTFDFTGIDAPRTASPPGSTKPQKDEQFPSVRECGGH